MNSDAAIRALGALAQGARLDVFRLLAREAPSGLAAGELGRLAGIRASTLSFHLQQLEAAGLIRSERRGRSLVYSLQIDSLHELFWFLGEDCCQGRTELCTPFTARIDAQLRGIDESLRPAVLFLCSRNSARSQMAEALLRREAGTRFDIHSGGLRPHEIHPFTLAVLEELDLDTSQLWSKDLGEFLGKVPIHYAITVCETANAECPRLHPFASQRLYWPFPDPVAAVGTEEERLTVFREVRDEIAERIRLWLQTELPGTRETPPMASGE